MQNKGALKLLVIALAIACIYQLSFTFVARNIDKKADQYASQFDPDLQTAMRENYLDSIRNKTVYNLGFIDFTYKEVKEKELNLGLDLKGGMNVLLEISPADIIKALSNDQQNPTFTEALEQARLDQVGGSNDFVRDFARHYERLSGSSRLIDLFSSAELSSSRELSMNATNDQVVEYLNRQVESAIDNSYNILSKRIDRFGIAQPNIQRVKNTGRILVELPGIKEPDRVRKLLQGAAALEFWMTYDNTAVWPILQQVDNLLAQVERENLPERPQADQTPAVTVNEPGGTTGEAGADAAGDQPVAGNDILDILEAGTDGRVYEADGLEALLADSLQSAQLSMMHPLFSKLEPIGGGGPVVGVANSYDMAAIDAIFARPEVKALLPNDLILMWGVKGIDREESIFQLFAIRDRSGVGRADLDGGAVENAREDYSQHGASAEVSMSMNRDGAIAWEHLTRDAIDPNNHRAGFSSCIAIVLDGYVYSAPTVHNVISGGRSSITGQFTIQEAKDLANVLKSGKLPAPARITQDNVVGPTLGQESIRSSMMSFVIAFVLVLLYMILFYNTAGWVACVALLANLFFLFGILVSFGAVLTLPGIAGIVLTMGMAVDANVIIYERIKEELRAGKALGAAVTAGYRNAMSAIIDANVTTLITAIILFWFGTGPVQGFATTLIIGIITSLFTSIFITRLIITSIIGRGKNVKFSNKFTENFLSNTKIDFISIRKISYVVSAVLILVSVISLTTRGLNYGVDFTGGRAYVVRFDQKITPEEVRTALENGFDAAPGNSAEKSFEVKQFGAEDRMQMRIVTQYRTNDDSPEASEDVEQLLFQSLKPLFQQQDLTYGEFATTATNPSGIITSDKVEASVAKEIVFDSFLAVLFGLIAIGIYIIIRFRKWQWGAGSVIALAHDAFLTIGIFSLLHGLLPFNLEIDQAFIAAILTIIGYSINDKVVIFDRIREYHTLFPKRSTRDNINNAINSTLSRTVNTSGTTFVTLLAIFLFGGEVIRGFVFALIFGIVVGTLSSIFTATPLAYDFMKRSARDKSSK